MFWHSEFYDDVIFFFPAAFIHLFNTESMDENFSMEALIIKKTFDEFFIWRLYGTDVLIAKQTRTYGTGGARGIQKKNSQRDLISISKKSFSVGASGTLYKFRMIFGQSHRFR